MTEENILEVAELHFSDEILLEFLKYNIVQTYWILLWLCITSSLARQKKKDVSLACQ